MVQITVVEETISVVVTIFSLRDERRGCDDWRDFMALMILAQCLQPTLLERVWKNDLMTLYHILLQNTTIGYLL